MMENRIKFLSQTLRNHQCTIVNAKSNKKRWSNGAPRLNARIAEIRGERYQAYRKSNSCALRVVSRERWDQSVEPWTTSLLSIRHDATPPPPRVLCTAATDRGDGGSRWQQPVTSKVMQKSCFSLLSSSLFIWDGPPILFLFCLLHPASNTNAL